MVEPEKPDQSRETEFKFQGYESFQPTYSVHLNKTLLLHFYYPIFNQPRLLKNRNGTTHKNGFSRSFSINVIINHQ